MVRLRGEHEHRRGAAHTLLSWLTRALPVPVVAGMRLRMEPAPSARTMLLRSGMRAPAMPRME